MRKFAFLLSFLFIFSTMAIFSLATTDSNFSVSINVVVIDPPNVSIILPENDTYTDDMIDFVYTANDSVGLDQCFFSFNGASNVTITTNITINAEEGENELYLYCNNTAGKMSYSYVNFLVELGMTGGGGTPSNVSCRGCPESTEWSSCVNSLQTMFEYQCGPSTKYECVKIFKSKNCGETAPEREITFLGNIGQESLLQDGISTDRVIIQRGERVKFQISVKNTGRAPLFNVGLTLNNMEYKPEFLNPTGMLIANIAGLYVTEVFPERIDMLKSGEVRNFDVSIFSTYDSLLGTYDVNATAFSGDVSDDMIFPIEIVQALDCCLFGICYKLIICWYWWIVLAIIAIITYFYWKKDKKRKR